VIIMFGWGEIRRPTLGLVGLDLIKILAAVRRR
jgi:hypothetical protein